MTNKPQRFKILRSTDPEALAREVSEHLEGIEFVDDDGFKTLHLYALHGDSRVVESDRCFPVDEPPRHYEQNVFVVGVSALVDRVKVEPAASEYTQ